MWRWTAVFATAAHALTLPLISRPDMLGCAAAIPPELKPGGPAYNYTDLASNSSADNPRRAYSITLPPHYQIGKPSPLILSFHGSGQDNKIQEIQSGFSDPLANPEAIVVYPQGINRLWYGDPEFPYSAINDTVFIIDLLNSLQANFCIERTRVYATGFSNGGGMTNRLLRNVEMSSRIAAAAIASGALYAGYQGTYLASRSNIPILELHGEADRRAPYYGGINQVRPGNYTNVAIPDWLDGWADREDCNATNTSSLVPNTPFGHVVWHMSWACQGRIGLVTHIRSQNQLHAWPTPESAGYHGSRVMLDFLARYTLQPHGIRMGMFASWAC